MLLQVLTYAALAACAHGKAASQWVEESRLAADAYSAEGKHTITIDDNCTVTHTLGNSAHSGPIQLEAGKGHVVEICSTGGKHYFSAPDLLADSAFRKAESVGQTGAIGYVKADVFKECEAYPGGCCAMFFVPLKAGEYTATDSVCNDKEIATVVVSGSVTEALEQETNAAWVAPEQRPAAFNGAGSSDWPGWSNATTIEVALVEDNSCSQGSRRRLQGSFSRSMLQTEEGDGEDLASEPTLTYVYSMGHTSVTTDLVSAGKPPAGTPSPAEGDDGVYEGNGEGEGADGVYEGNNEGEGTDGVAEGGTEGATPSPDEGADGVNEGSGEGGATPSPDEGADGVNEGNGEGTSGTPSPDEGADGVFEGNGEGSGGTPSPDEGADGVNEGNGEGTGGTPSPDEGADGVFEGNGEGSGGTPSPNEGADGVNEGNGEGTSGTPSPDEGADGVNEGNGEGTSGTPAPDEGADGVIEGNGEGTAPAGRRLRQAAPSPDEGADGVTEGNGEGSGGTPSPDEGADGVFEGNGEGGAEGEGGNPSPDEGADGVYEGTGEGEGGGDVEVVDAGEHPIEMVVGQGYIIRHRLIRSSANHYFTAKDFFVHSLVRKFQDVNAEYKFATYPIEYELFGDDGVVEMYLVPATPGEYTLTAGEVSEDRLNGAKIRVVASADELTDPASIAPTTISALPCATGGSSLEGGEGVNAAPMLQRSICLVVLAFCAWLL